MAWQEWFFIVGNFAQVVMLIPMMRSPIPPPRTSSIPLTLTLSGFTFAFASLDLWWSAVAMASVTLCWAWLAIKRPVTVVL